MPKFTVLIHARAGDAHRLARLLETLHPADQALVINHGESDIAEAARTHGASVKQAVPGVSDGAYAVDSDNDWILCLLPTEALTETLAASLFEWKERDHENASSFSAAIREQNPNGSCTLPPETRLINRTVINWTRDLPENDSTSHLLSGELLRLE